jgi:hypothetical protein
MPQSILGYFEDQFDLEEFYFWTYRARADAESATGRDPEV